MLTVRPISSRPRRSRERTRWMSRLNCCALAVVTRWRVSSTRGIEPSLRVAWPRAETCLIPFWQFSILWWRVSHILDLSPFRRRWLGMAFNSWEGCEHKCRSLNREVDICIKNSPPLYNWGSEGVELGLGVTTSVIWSLLALSILLFCMSLLRKFEILRSRCSLQKDCWASSRSRTNSYRTNHITHPSILNLCENSVVRKSRIAWINGIPCAGIIDMSDSQSSAARSSSVWPDSGSTCPVFFPSKLQLLAVVVIMSYQFICNN